MANNQMPHNSDVEKALLGCIILDESVQSEILESLKEEELYEESHRLILVAMQEIYRSRKTIDLVTLIDRLEKNGTLDRAGGYQYISELAELTPSAANYKQYLELVRRDAINRFLVRAGKDIIEHSMASSDERESLSFAEKLIYDISQQEDSSKLIGLADGEVIGEVLHKFEEIQRDPNAHSGLRTGFRRLDSITHGLQKGSLVIIAARPGVGKTSLAMNIVENVCVKSDKVAAIFSLEMPRTELVQRLLCSHANISMEQALSGTLKQKEWKRLMYASDEVSASKIFIDDSSVVTPAEILSKCRRLKASEGRLDLIMVDYIQLMEGGGKTAAENRQQEIASITRALKIMAKELEVPVIALSQLRRLQQAKEPQLSDLRESGSIEQDADIVIFINRPEESADETSDGKVVRGGVELNIAKHRNGATGKIQLRFLGEQTKFVDVESLGEPVEDPTRPLPPPEEPLEEGETDIPLE